MTLNKITAHSADLHQQIQRNKQDTVNPNRQFIMTVQKTASLTGFNYTVIPAGNSKKCMKMVYF